jgi:hypothetical protein
MFLVFRGQGCNMIPSSTHDTYSAIEPNDSHLRPRTPKINYKEMGKKSIFGIFPLQRRISNQQLIELGHSQVC